ncbi:phospholipid carrier-dependent glycosyltransferase [Phytoactinopolyspora alkaliphila]|uniref:Polyprenol-phosphate-mannose--protein mannosyltransferase n=2 Tax=Phytoactinopolyspora alkaliphila TaxID=1783498 RepID=A0A6N9YI09_9ACTN|nr:glycosyltransferase family 39 protein [Phytoactinopolyspora alkaliphila]NED94587.1 phospholipid carrier-dependent glycosyltransferase [Phytoactinopolyspora alkaliphila]
MPRDGLWGWLGPVIVAAVAAVLRLVDLGRPHSIIFDETYYAKDAFAQLTFGYARKFVDDADEMIIEGDLDVFADEPSFVVHPPVGKFLIGQGIRLLGMEPTGWRLATALAGVVTVFLIARAGRRLFRSTLLGCTAGLLLAVDGMAIATSRTAILDGLLAMFVVAAFACLLVDRDHSRTALATWVHSRRSAGMPLGDGPVIGWRPWRLAAGVMLGLACGTKWSGLYVVAVFGLMSVVWEISARRAAGLPSPALNTLLRDGPVAFVTTIGSALVVYVGSWWGWIFSDNSWGRGWAATNPATGLSTLIPDWLRSLWHYHDEIWRFHTNLTTEHTYESSAWTWLFLGRPVSFDYQSLEQGEAGCDVAKCSQEVLALGNPVLWWGACAALVVCLLAWFLHRDWRPGAILAGIAATWVPWLFYPERTTFAFYAAAIVPFLTLAVAYTLGLIIGPPADSPRRKAVGIAVAGAFVLVAVVVAAWFYPIHVDEVMPYDEWRKRMWFSSWI